LNAENLLTDWKSSFLPAAVSATIRAMPSQIAEHASACSTKLASVSEVPSAAERAAGVKILRGPDPSIHMLGLPESHPQLGRWVALAILMGAIVAFTLIGILAR
jgi:hypothetical protein